jgi:hypothetical protein
MASAVIGGIKYEVPELNFIALEKAWPFIERAIITQDPMEGTSAGVSIIAAGLLEAEGFDPTGFGIAEDEKLSWDDTFDRVVIFLKRALKSGEIGNVRTCVEQITEEAGLREDEPGEAQAPVEEEAIPSTETAPDTSQSSLPLDAREEAGTA